MSTSSSIYCGKKNGRLTLLDVDITGQKLMANCRCDCGNLHTCTLAHFNSYGNQFRKQCDECRQKPEVKPVATKPVLVCLGCPPAEVAGYVWANASCPKHGVGGEDLSFKRKKSEVWF